jgi:hypothetical protein
MAAKSGAWVTFVELTCLSTKWIANVDATETDQPMRTILFAAVAIGLSVTGPSELAAQKIRFEKSDVALLKRIAAVKELSQASAKLLLTVPVFELLSSTSLTDLVVTVTSNDWDKLPAAAGGMTKISACTIRDLIVVHLNDRDEGPPPPDVAKYFAAIHDQMDNKC